MSDEKPPSWLRVEYIALAFQIVVAIGAVSVWAINSASKTDSTTAAMITVNARLDRIFEKLDVLPVLVEKVRQAEIAIGDSKGGYSTLDVRLRMIEQNNAANHADIQSVLPPQRKGSN